VGELFRQEGAEDDSAQDVSVDGDGEEEVAQACVAREGERGRRGRYFRQERGCILVREEGAVGEAGDGGGASLAARRYSEDSGAELAAVRCGICEVLSFFVEYTNTDIMQFSKFSSHMGEGFAADQIFKREFFIEYRLGRHGGFGAA